MRGLTCVDGVTVEDGGAEVRVGITVFVGLFNGIRVGARYGFGMLGEAQARASVINGKRKFRRCRESRRISESPISNYLSLNYRTIRFGIIALR